MTTLALAVLLCMAKPEYEAHPPAQAAGIAGYASMLVVERRPRRDEAEINVDTLPSLPPLPNAVKPKEEPKPQLPAAKPVVVVPRQPTEGYWRTECNGGSCHRVWVHGGQRTYHYRGLFRRR